MHRRDHPVMTLNGRKGGVPTLVTVQSQTDVRIWDTSTECCRQAADLNNGPSVVV